MKKFIFILFTLSTINVFPSEPFQNTINKKNLKIQINDFFNNFIEQKRNENSTINSFIVNNEDDFETYVAIYKIRIRNTILKQSNGLGFMFERNLLATIINDLYNQAEKIDNENNNTLVQDFLKQVSGLENEF